MYRSRFEYVKALIRYALSAKYRAFIRRQKLFGELMRGIEAEQSWWHEVGISSPEAFDEFTRLDELGLRVCEWWGKQYE